MTGKNKHKLIVFDLDGVLLSSKDLHYEALNTALKEVDDLYVITKQDHLQKFDGLKTSEKLEILTKERGLLSNLHNQI